MNIKLEAHERLCFKFLVNTLKTKSFFEHLLDTVSKSHHSSLTSRLSFPVLMSHLPFLSVLSQKSRVPVIHP